MGNRCAIGFQFDHKIKATYSHWGSHPSDLGRKISLFLSKMTESQRQQFKKRAESIQWASIRSKATADDIKKYKCFARIDVTSERLSEWDNLLFNTQGIDCLVYLLTGALDHFIDNTAMLKDSLNCESGYIINFDDNTLDFYIGYQATPDPENPFGQEIAYTFENKSYYPCKRVLQVDLINPMSCTEWASMIEEK
mgnify:CR=1 FL=1